MLPQGRGGSWMGGRRGWLLAGRERRGDKVGFWDLLVTIPDLGGKSYSFVWCSSWEFALQETVHCWLFLNTLGKRSAESSHAQERNARFSGGFAKTQQLLRSLGDRGARGVFAFQWERFWELWKLSLVLPSHWQAEQLPGIRDRRWRGLCSKWREGTLGNFNCSGLGHRAETKGVESSWQIENTSTVRFYTKAPSVWSHLP